MKKITPYLWFDGQAEEAARLYTSIFKNSSIDDITRCGKEAAAATGMPEGSAMIVSFTIDGQEFIGLNGGPMFKFTEAVSFAVKCETQEEIDYLWSSLTADGGEESMCGWLKDKFGLSWQVVPAILTEMMNDAKKAKKVMPAMLQMKKLDIQKLMDAAKG